MNYGLSLRSVNLDQYQPHPLGDPLYVATGKFFLLFTGDEREAAWAASFLGYALLLFLVAIVLRRASFPSLATKLLLIATSPLLVKEALLVNPDIWEGTLFLYAFLLEQHFSKKRWRSSLFFLLGVGLGFRLTLLYYLSFFLIALHFRLLRERDFASLLLFWVGVCLWALPFFIVAGGVGHYFHAIAGRQEPLALSFFVQGPTALWRNLRQVGIGLFYGLGAGVLLIPLLFWAAYPFRKTLLVLFLPSLGYFILIVCNVSNYLTAASAIFLFLLAREKRVPFFFLLFPVLLNILILFSVVFPSLHKMDIYWAKRIACVRTHFHPEDTLLYFELHYSETERFFFRHAYFYLPEYTLLYRSFDRREKWWWRERKQLQITTSFPLQEKAFSGRTVVYGNEGEGKGEVVSCQGEKFHVQRGKDFLRWLIKNDAYD